MTWMRPLRHGAAREHCKKYKNKNKNKKVVTIHRNRIFVVSILLQFQFVASRLVLDFSVGSFGVRCSCCRSAARRLGGVFVIGVGVGVGSIGCNLPLFFFCLFAFILFFWKCICFGLGQYLTTTTEWQNLNCFIAVFGFFLEHTGSRIWSLLSWRLPTDSNACWLQVQMIPVSNFQKFKWLRNKKFLRFLNL